MRARPRLVAAAGHLADARRALDGVAIDLGQAAADLEDVELARELKLGGTAGDADAIGYLREDVEAIVEGVRALERLTRGTHTRVTAAS